MLDSHLQAMSVQAHYPVVQQESDLVGLFSDTVNRHLHLSSCYSCFCCLGGIGKHNRLRPYIWQSAGLFLMQAHNSIMQQDSLNVAGKKTVCQLDSYIIDCLCRKQPVHLFSNGNSSGSC